jgi:hypothetical protein
VKLSHCVIGDAEVGLLIDLIPGLRIVALTRICMVTGEMFCENII